MKSKNDKYNNMNSKSMPFTSDWPISKDLNKNHQILQNLKLLVKVQII